MLPFLVSGAVRPALASPPAYSGNYVVIDPYDYADMKFLRCAAATTPGAGCYNLSASNMNFLNPFTGVEFQASGPTAMSQAANGILLRIPWCGFQTSATIGTGEASPTLGECHYQVWGTQVSMPTTATGTIYAGAYGATTHQLYSTGGDPQGGVDDAIDNLSMCTTPYDTGGTGGCSSSILDTALNYMVTIAGEMSSGSLKVSIGLMAGEYTPTSVMSIVPTLDMPQREGSTYTACERQPLAWHTTGTSPYVETAYEKAYTNALLALGAEVYRVAGGALQLEIIKEAAITSNSIEFDVPARATYDGLYTYVDPQASSPPQGGSAIQCPDQYSTSETTVKALLDAYSATGSSLIMTDAYEYTFGYIMGYEEGATAVSGGPASGALLSVPTKGLQAFAQVNCGQEGSESTCVLDSSSSTYQYNWEDYYFFEFLKDLDTSGTPASVGVAAGYAKACTGVTCSPSSLSTISPSSMSVVDTGLDVTTDSPNEYTAQPECWINNTTTADDEMLPLYTSGTPTTVTLHGTGVVLGWQTDTNSGMYCGNALTPYSLIGCIQNGAQYIEIETDAAAEGACDSNLSSTLGTLLGGTGNTYTTCLY